MAISFNEQSQAVGTQKVAIPLNKKSVVKKTGSFWKSLNAKFIKIPVKEKLFLVQQLSIMIQTGISLAVALKTLEEQTKNKNFKSILKELKENVEKGNPLSDGLAKYKKIFGDLFINMIRAGETTGRLEEVLKELFIQMKKDHDIVSKVRGAMIYPSVVISAMILVGTLVVVYIIPNLLTIFREVGGTLPLPTRILMALSDFVTAYGIFVAIGAVLGITAFVKTIRTHRGRYIFHKILLSLPILGTIVQKINLARFCRTLSSLLKTDIAIVTTFEITSEVLGNELYKKALTEAKEKIKKGHNVHDSLEPYKNLFPPMILQMVSVGEETGALDRILDQSATFFEDEVEQTMKNLPTIIEPVLILILGLGVAAMAVAVLMPLYSLGQQI